MKPRALDLFCGAGGATRGLQLAGFHVTGIDIKPQPRYCGDAFIQADALRPPVRLSDFDLVWASPPCQRYSQCTPLEHREKHPDLIAIVRHYLQESGAMWVIENVPSAKRWLRSPAMLCGSMFGLKVRRHRLFESSFFVPTSRCVHMGAPVLITGTHRRTYEPRYEYTAAQCREAADLPWMTRTDMDQAIPPAYSKHIGEYALMALGVTT